MKRGSQPRNYQLYVNISALIISVYFLLAVLCPADLQAKPVSSEKAQKAIKGWLKVNPIPLQTQLGNQVRQTDVFTDDNGEPVYYVIYLRPSGFIIAPADDMVEPIIVFADDGTYNPSPNNPLGALVSRDIPGRVAAARNLRATAGDFRKKPASQQTSLEKASLGAERKWAELNEDSNKMELLGIPSVSDVRVAPLLLSEWGQTEVCYSGWYCYNYYTPSHYPCGCVATAMAQLMRYHQHPAGYAWSSMPLKPFDICGSITLTQRMTIGDLCYDAAESVDMMYGPGGSSAYIWKVRDALPYTFGYSNAIDGWYNNYDLSGPNLNGMVNPGLDAGFPSLLGITGDGGHAVVADGYGYQSSTLYHHINMGWDGIDDAWYNLPIIDAYYYFNVVEECIYNIYKSGTGEIISGRVTNTSGVPISGATVTGVKTGGGTYIDTTDSYGIYALAKVPSSSTYTVSVTKTGYTFTSQGVTTGYSQHDHLTSGNKWGINFVGTVSGPTPPIADPNTVMVEQGEPEIIELQARDDGLPNPPGMLSYIITSLPNHGRITDPCTGKIESVPYILADNGNQVVYTNFCAYSGSDSFGFKANDGGTPPTGGDSGIATITINVQSPAPVTLYETGFNGGLPSGWTIIDGLSDGYTWTTTNYYLEQVAEWAGKTYMVVGYEFTGANMDEQLITQSIDCSGLVDVKLSFKHILKHYSNEVADVDVRVNGGSWQNVQRYNAAGEYTTTGVVEKDLSSIADGQSNVQIRWHYYDADWEWYWGIDDVKITASEESPPPPTGDFESDCHVDFYDLSIFASAWLSDSGSGNWNPICDIYEPADNSIDFLDYAVFAENWLAGL